MIFQPGIIASSKKPLLWTLFDQDDFTGADSSVPAATDGGRSYDDAGWTPTRSGRILSNRYTQGGSIGYSWRRFNVDSMSHALEMEYYSNAGYHPDFPVNVNLRFQDQNNFVGGAWRKDSAPNRIDIWKKIGGVFTEIGRYSIAALATGDRLKWGIVRENDGTDSVYVWYNDALVISSTGISGLPSTQKVGFAVYNLDTHNDNMKCWLYQ
jgi:hypothetical protein